jgi:hypothetical protein
LFVLINSHLPADFSRKHRTKPVTPELNCPIANFDTALEQDVLELVLLQRITDTHLHDETGDLSQQVEIVKVISQRMVLRTAHYWLKLFCSENISDSAHQRVNRDPVPSTLF